MHFLSRFFFRAAVFCLFAVGMGRAAAAPESILRIYWIDCDGGGSTLIVTPQNESILIDAGFPGPRDPARIMVAAKDAGITQIDHFILTHFHRDHFGGAPWLVRTLPIRTAYDQGIPARNLDVDGGGEAFFAAMVRDYARMPVRRHVLLRPGLVLPLRSSAASQPALQLRCLTVAQRFVAPAPGQARNAVPTTPGPDPKLVATENLNSAAFLLTFGPFRFYDGGDLNWYQEEKLVSPYNLVGPVDVYQVDTHGLDTSSPPALLHSLTPTVAVIPNGPKKGGGAATIARLKALPSLRGLFQIHTNTLTLPEENADPAYIANIDEGCAGNYIKLSVSADGRWYTVSISATGFSRTYRTAAK